MSEQPLHLCRRCGSYYYGTCATCSARSFRARNARRQAAAQHTPHLIVYQSASDAPPPDPS